MKRILSIVLAAALLCTTALMFTACGSAEKKELHMATNAEFEPYEYFKGDDVIGIDPEIAQAICDKLGYELVVDHMDFDAIITAVTSGKADFGMAGMTVTDERKESVDFTDTYTKTTQVIIVSDKSFVKNADDLEKAKIGVQLGTTGDIFASDIKGATVEQFKNGADAVVALSQGKIDCVIIDAQPAKKFVEANKGLKILDEPFAEEEYAICTAKDSELTEKINDALKELKEDGTVQKIIDKYIK